MTAVATVTAGWRGVDYSFGRPDPVELRRLGYRFAVRYISPTVSNPKNVTAAEIAALHAAGVGVLLVWESTATRPFAGAAAGAADGKASAAWCSRLGYPSGVPVMAAVDTDVTASTLAKVLAYLDAFAAEVAPWPLGVYADTDVIEAMAGRSVLNWKPNARAWSTKPSSLVHVQQHASTSLAGAVVDTNTALRPFPVWLPSSDPTPIIPPTEEADMRPRLIKPDGDAAQFVTDGVHAVWAVSGPVIAAMQGAGVWDTAPVQTVPRAALKALTLVGPEPDYSAGDGGQAGRTTRADFAPEHAPILAGTVTVSGSLVVEG